MRTTCLITCASAAALLLAGCDGNAEMRVKHTEVDDEPGRYRVVEKLECPEREGDLRLSFVAADGRSCSYKSRRGAEVELRLVALDGRTADVVLGAIEAELGPLVPGAPAAEPSSPPQPPAPPEAPEARTGEQSEVRIPGVVDIRANDKSASIRLPGVTIDASDDKAKVRVRGEDGERVTVDAQDKAARVRAHSDRNGDLKSTFILASEAPGPQGWRVAGYEARGPVNGPLVVGVGKVKDDNDDSMDDMEDLVSQNLRKRR